MEVQRTKIVEGFYNSSCSLEWCWQYNHNGSTTDENTKQTKQTEKSSLGNIENKQKYFDRSKVESTPPGTSSCKGKWVSGERSEKDRQEWMDYHFDSNGCPWLEKMSHELFFLSGREASFPARSTECGEKLMMQIWIRPSQWSRPWNYVRFLGDQ